MTISEELLNLGYDYGTLGGPRFSTTVVVDGQGQEQRAINWTQPLGRWQIGNRVVNREELDYFLDFHSDRKGAFEGFRFKDWSDYSFNNEIAVGDGVTTEFQLIKVYSVGSYSVSRPITKPRTGVVVKVDGEIIEIALDTITGLISFSSPPALDAIIEAAGDFDVPVRFEQDSIQFRFFAADSITGEAFFELSNLSVVEIRQFTEIPFEELPTLSHTIDLGYDYETLGGPGFLTKILSNRAGAEKRISQWTASKRRFQLGDRTLNKEELSYFLSLFRICRGAALSFQFKDWQTEQVITVRFETDEIAVRFDAANSDEVIFYLSGLPVVETSLRYGTLITSVTSTFEDAVERFPPNGIYPFTIEAPEELDEYPDIQIRAYLTSAQWDNRSQLGLFANDTLGTYGGNFFIGIGKTFTAVVVQDSLGPCYFTGTIRWEAWTIS